MSADINDECHFLYRASLFNLIGVQYYRADGLRESADRARPHGNSIRTRDNSEDAVAGSHHASFILERVREFISPT